MPIIIRFPGKDMPESRDRYRGSDLACFWQTAGRSGLSELEKESFPDL